MKTQPAERHDTLLDEGAAASVFRDRVLFAVK